MDRRVFLKILGTASAGLVGPGCGSRYDRFFDLEEDLRPAIPLDEKYINTVCQLCGAGCGIQARVANGNVIRTIGNPLSPVNRGKVCLRGAAGPQHLYNSKRIQHPLILDGEKGSGNFRNIGWDEALALVADRLQQLRESNEPQKVTLLSGYQPGLLDRLFRNFFLAYGSPNYLRIEHDIGIRTILKLMHGYDEEHIGYDLENVNYILNFGINLFESSASPVWYNWVYGYLRRERQEGRAKLVHIDSIGSVSALKSDEWIKINPGTSGALALGIAQILVTRNLYNSEFLRTNTFGFEDWTDTEGVPHNGFKTLLLEEYDPATVSEVTGVSIRTIEQLAREFAANAPAVAIFDDNTAQYTGGIYSQMAIHSLNALVGNINTPGGIFLQQGIPFTDWPDVKQDHIALNGLSRKRIDQAHSDRFSLAESIIPNLLLDQADGQIDTLFVHNCNPLYTFSEHERYAELFQRIPFIVNFSSFFDETSQFCDLLLPEPTFLEKWQDVPSGNQTGLNQVLGLMKPVISPLYDTKHVGDVFLHLARALGPPVSDALPWNNFEDLLRYSLEGIFKSRSGVVFSGAYDRSWAESLERAGWSLPGYTSFDEFWSQLIESGGWWNPLFPENGNQLHFQTPSRKFEFFSQSLFQHYSSYKNAGEDTDQSEETSARSGETQRIDDNIFLPHYEPPRFAGNVIEYPLVLYPYETGALRSGALESQPSLMGVLNPFSAVNWESWAEINPETARKYDLRHRDVVWIESPSGKITVRLAVSDRIVPGVIGIPLGLGHKEPRETGSIVGVNPNSILVTNVDELTGIDTKKGTRVKVYRVLPGVTNA